MLRILAFIDFVDSSGTPRDDWRRYRGANHRQILAESITKGYQELFAVYPDANQRSDAELESFFSTRTAGGKQVISRLVRTFKTLCDLADFSSLQSSSFSTPTGPVVSHPSPLVESSILPSQTGSSTQKRPTPHISFNIQVVLPENASPETYDNIFKSIATHLLGHTEEQ